MTHNPGARQFADAEKQAAKDAKHGSKAERAERDAAAEVVNSRGEVIGADDRAVDRFNQTPDANQEAVGQSIAGETA